MKRYRLWIALAIFFLPLRAAAQTTDSTAAADTNKYGWKHTLVTSLNLSQTSFTNWEAGGQNSLAYVLLINGQSVQDMKRTNWTTNYNFAYGEARLGGSDLRKTDDKIDLATVFTYKMDAYVNPYASVTFLSQFTTGYQYNDTSKTAVSGLLDPAYSVQSAGFGYQPWKTLKTRLGLGLRETFTNKYNQYSDDPSTVAIEKTRVEGGLESVTELALPIDDNILITSKLQLFSPFKTMDKIVVHSDNLITAKVSKYISTNFTLSLINDQVVTPRTQIKEGLSVGITYSIF